MHQQPVVLHYHRPITLIDPESKAQALRALRILGPLCAVFGFAPALILISFAGITPPVLLLATTFTFLGIAGITYSICAFHIKRNDRAAALVALILASVHLVLFALLFLLGLLAMLAQFSVAIMIMMFTAMFMMGLWDLLLHLKRCVRSFTHLPNAA